MKKKIFIDGKSGTTGLRIEERLSKRDDIEIFSLSEELRKDYIARKKIINESDIVFLCLPDDAAKEAVNMVENPETVIIDTSTAHRTNDDFAYGFPELGKEFEEKIKASNRISVPGCHASGFIALVYPLIKNGFLSEEEKITSFSITGYSGGGKKMISEYENEKGILLNAPRQYGIGQNHKHIPEIVKVTGLKNKPIFCPVVSDFYSGMEMTIPLFNSQLKKGNIDDIKELYRNIYNSKIVSFVEQNDENGFLSSAKLENYDSMTIEVYGNDERILLVSRYDNLGKGASGAAIECLNIKLGCDKTKGLEL